MESIFGDESEGAIGTRQRDRETEREEGGMAVEEGGRRACRGGVETIVCVTDGSYGDVLPFLAIATQLAEAGRKNDNNDNNRRKSRQRGGGETVRTENVSQAEGWGHAPERRKRKVYLLASEHFQELVQRANAATRAADANRRGDGSNNNGADADERRYQHEEEDEDEETAVTFIPTCSKDFYSERWGEKADPKRSINSNSTLISGARSMVERQRGIYALLKRIIVGTEGGGPREKDSVSETASAEHVVPALIISHPLVSAAKMFAENYGPTRVQLVSVLLSPIYLRSLDHAFYPRCMMSWYYCAADMGLDAVLAPPINALRRDLVGSDETSDAQMDTSNHRDVRRVCNGWLFSDSLVVALFPSWFTRSRTADVSVGTHDTYSSEHAPTAPRRTVFAGFIMPERAVLGGSDPRATHMAHGETSAAHGSDESVDAAIEAVRNSAGLDDEVVAHLIAHFRANANVRFVVFTPGSLNPPNATHFFRESTKAVHAINRAEKLTGERVAAIFLTKYKSVLPAEVVDDEKKNTARETTATTKPASIKHFTFVSLSALLPHCHLCVHHGGIGTIGSCLSSSTPSVIVPSAFDQFDNADIMEKLGVGVTVAEKNFTSDAVLRAMHRLIGVGGNRSGSTRDDTSHSSSSTNNKVGCIGSASARNGGIAEWKLVSSRCRVLADDINSSSSLARTSSDDDTTTTNLGVVVSLVDEILRGAPTLD